MARSYVTMRWSEEFGISGVRRDWWNPRQNSSDSLKKSQLSVSDSLGEARLNSSDNLGRNPKCVWIPARLLIINSLYHTISLLSIRWPYVEGAAVSQSVDEYLNGNHE